MHECLNYDRYEEQRFAAEYSEDHPEHAYSLVDFDSPYAFGYVNQAPVPAWFSRQGVASAP